MLDAEYVTAMMLRFVIATGDEVVLAFRLTATEIVSLAATIDGEFVK